MSGWRSSIVRESVLEVFTEKGFLPPKEVAHWRSPGREDFPQPQASVVWFLHRLLNEWGLELQHLNPTGVVHIVGFITVSEAFLGMEPHVDFFQRMFSRRALSEGKPLMIAPMGGFTL